MLLLDSFVDLVGKLYLEGGRGPKEYDCYGLVIECARRQGIILPDYQSKGSRSENQAEVFRAMDNGWRRCEDEPGAVILFKVQGTLSHVGFLIVDDSFIHAAAINGQVVIQRLFHPHWRNRIEGFYKYEPAFRDR